MAYPPHPLALFSLIPLNERAKSVLEQRENTRHVSTLPNGKQALDVGFQLHGTTSTTLATLGRHVDADIYVEGGSIAKIQCSFEIDLDTGIVMLFDRSHGHTTQVFCQNVRPFEHGRVRKVLVQEKLNTIIGMGGECCNLFEFKLKWHRDSTKKVEAIKSNNTLPCPLLENPRLAQTVHEAPTDFSSRRITRLHTTGPWQLEMRHVKMTQLGSGQFGVVWKTIDVDSGKLMAVKVLKRPTRGSQEEVALKREVETLSAISHPHIIDFICSQGWDKPDVEIFMGLKEGTVDSLLKSGAEEVAVAESVFPQMLQALDFIAWNGIIHPDVKPENILYTSHPKNGYLFQLGDFGLCKRIVDPGGPVGTPIYKAPEMFNGMDQKHKVDIWSLFITMLWILDVQSFRVRSIWFHNHEEVRRAVSSAASEKIVSRTVEMAIENPERRASAAQMLVMNYGGAGLSTPGNQVPALTIDSSSTIAAARAPPPARSPLTTRTPQTERRGF